MSPKSTTELAACLRNQGLFARSEGDAVLIGLQRRDVESDRSIDVERYGRIVQIRSWEFDGETIFLEDEAYVERIRDSWSFRNTVNLFFGEPNLDCIQITLASLSSLLPVILNYYFGSPVKIGDWQIPIHQHPKWSCDKVEQAIRRAEPWQFPQLERMRLESLALTSERPPRGIDYEIFNTMDDLLYYRVIGEEKILFLRMDCEKAMICSRPTEAEKAEIVKMYLKELGMDN